MYLGHCTDKVSELFPFTQKKFGRQVSSLGVLWSPLFCLCLDVALMYAQCNSPLCIFARDNLGWGKYTNKPTLLDIHDQIVS